MTYDASVTTLVPSTAIDSESKRRVASDLAAVEASGSTCISCALEAGVSALSNAQAVKQNGQVVKQIVLLSDGEATAGVKTLSGFSTIAQRAREAGIGVSSIGIDVDYNEALLSTLARLSNGRHHFVRNPGDLALAFDRELGELAGSVASNVRLSIELAPGVEVSRVFDREVERVDSRLTVELGAFTNTDEKTFLVQLTVPSSTPGEAALASFSFRYDPVGSSGAKPTEVHGILGTEIDESAQAELDPVVAARIGKSRTGALLFEAGKLFASGEPDDFAKLDQKFATELRRIDRERGTRPSGHHAAELGKQRAALETARKKMVTTRGSHCGCAAGDLMCAMRCSAGPPKTKSCMPGDPLCADVGDLSGDEKSAAKESVGASNPFLK